MNLKYEHAFDYFSTLIKSYNYKTPLVIAFDGRSSSGKTTLANRLAKVFNIPVIHTDDFYRPKDKNGNLSITEHDGNFDLKRFQNEVVDCIKTQKAFKYGIFDCQMQRIEQYVEVPISKCYIIEGAYSLNPYLGDYADIKVFFDIEHDLQKNRIINRNGVQGYERFKEIWLPAEERYLEHYRIFDRCNIIIKNKETIKST